MKRVVLTGGGSGGHVFPLLAVADELRNASNDIELFYCGPVGTFRAEFLGREIKTCGILGSKLRRYISLANLFEFPKFLVSLIQAFLKLLIIMPDGIFSKGGPGALAVVLAARFYRIPVMIHESDAVPGLTNSLSARFAQKIGVAFEASIKHFPEEKTSCVGNPIRPALLRGIPSAKDAKRFLGLNPESPTMLVLGGSQGAVRLNTFIAENMEELLKIVQMVHQGGPANYKTMEEITRSIPNALKNRYKAIPFLSVEELRNAFAAADIVLSRAGSGAISEIAAFGKPALLVPLPESARDHQRRNAYAYAHYGGAMVFEEANLKTHLILDEIRSLLKNEERRSRMSEAAASWAKPNAAKEVAADIMSLR